MLQFVASPESLVSYQAPLNSDQATWEISAALQSACIESMHKLRRFCEAGKF